jgi:hypothetical protein
MLALNGQRYERWEEIRVTPENDRMCNIARLDSPWHRRGSPGRSKTEDRTSDIKRGQFAGYKLDPIASLFKVDVIVTNKAAWCPAGRRGPAAGRA